MFVLCWYSSVRFRYLDTLMVFFLGFCISLFKSTDTALRRNSCVFQKAPKDRRAGRLLSYLEGQQCCFDGLCLYPDFEMFVEKMKIAAKFSSPFPSFVVSSETVSAAISSFKQHSLETLSAVEKGESRVLPEREQRHNRGRPSSLPLPVDTYFWTQIQSDISRMTPKQRKELWQSLPSIFRRSNVEASVVEMMAHYLALCSLLSCYERVEDDSVAFLLSLVRPTGALPMNINTKGLVVAHVKVRQSLYLFYLYLMEKDRSRSCFYSSHRMTFVFTSLVCCVFRYCVYLVSSSFF